MQHHYFMNLFYFHFKVQKIECIDISKHQSAFSFQYSGTLSFHCFPKHVEHHFSHFLFLLYIIYLALFRQRASPKVKPLGLFSHRKSGST